MLSAAADAVSLRLFVLWYDAVQRRCLLEALSLSDGSVLWSRPMAVNTSEFTVAGKLLVLTEASRTGERQLAFSGDDGKVVWEQHTAEMAKYWERWLSSGWDEREWDPRFPSRDPGTSAPAVGGDLVVFGSYTHHLYGRNLATGELRWRYAPALEFITGGFSSISIANGRLTFGYSGFLYSVDAADPSREDLLRLYKDWGDRASMLRAAVGRGRAFTPGWANHWLNCLDGETLQPLWRKPGQFSSFPAIAGDLVWLSRDEDYYQRTPAGLHGYDFDGRLVWFTPGSFSEPAIADGRVYLLGEEPGTRALAVVCLVPDPRGAPFRNLAVEPVGVVQQGSPVVLRITNTGASAEHGVLLVVDVARRKDDRHGGERVARHRFRLGALAPGQHRDVTLDLPAERVPTGWLYLAAFLPNVKDGYVGDNQIAVSF